MTLDDRLQGWLDTATAGLSEQSKCRVAHEITEHHRDACAEGLDHNAALERLGDPAAARREFRKAYLTSFEESLVRDYRGLPPKWRWVVYSSLFLIGCAVALRLPEAPRQRIAGYAMLVVLTAAMTKLFFLVPRLYRRGRHKAAILVGAISDWMLYAGLIVGSSLVLGDLTVAKSAFFLTILGVLLVLYVPLLRKLRRGEPWTRSRS